MYAIIGTMLVSSITQTHVVMQITTTSGITAFVNGINHLFQGISQAIGQWFDGMLPTINWFSSGVGKL
ncbi:hypothetical protein M1589_04790 [Candidatus Marsarchaeota archaeon]|jgi:hypothetical protein|nr:hypothetical protein [Candidatus Marsarchaeota archaeon]MCL5115428.1 hypothetical protein [Candidatus Marsarchaeota archaeon]